MAMFTRLSARSRPEPAPLPYEESSEQGLAARWVRWVGATGEVLLDGVPQPLREIATPRPFEVTGSLGNGVTGRRGPCR